MKHSLLTLIIGSAFAVSVAKADVTSLSASSKVKFSDLPAAVQNTVKAQAGSAEIEDVEKGTLNGQTVYEVAYKNKGQHTELRVSESGSVVDTIVAGQSTGAAATSTQTATTTGGTTTAPTAASASTSVQPVDPAYNAGFQKELGGGVKVSFNQLPENVKQIVKERAGSAQIEDIDKGSLGGATAYQMAYKKNGKHTELRVTEDGRFAKEVVGGQAIFWHNVVKWNAVPQNIKTVVHNKIGNTPVNWVLSGQGPQGPFYRFFFKKNGQHTELRVMKNGTDVKEMAISPIIREGAGAEK